MNKRDFQLKYILGFLESGRMGLEDAVRKAEDTVPRVAHLLDPDNLEELRDILEANAKETLPQAAARIMKSNKSLQAYNKSASVEQKVSEAQEAMEEARKEAINLRNTVKDLEARLQNTKAEYAGVVRLAKDEVRSEIRRKIEFVLAHTHNADQLEGIQRALDKV